MKTRHSLYMLVGPKNELVFSPPGTTAQDAWCNYENTRLEGDYIMGTGADHKNLHARGFRARNVLIEIQE